MAVGILGPGGPGTKKKKQPKKKKYSNNTKACKGNFKDKGKSICKPKKTRSSILKSRPKKNKTTTTTTSKTAKGRIGTPVTRKKKEEIVTPTPSFKSKNPRFL